jgi:hypothetical protein
VSIKKVVTRDAKPAGRDICPLKKKKAKRDTYLAGNVTCVKEKKSLAET